MTPSWRRQWCLGRLDSAFLAQVERVLNLYEQPYDPAEPLLCLDETPVHLRRPARPTLPPQPGRAARQDYEYVRQGTCNLFVAVEPQAGRRQLQDTARRTRQDFADFVRRLVDEHYPTARCVHLVLDDLNIHSLAAHYEVFPAREARRLRRKIRLHFTPKHASWLNMAEIALSAVARYALRARVPDQQTLQRRIAACERDRNARQARIHWRFTSDDAQVKFQRHYLS